MVNANMENQAGAAPSCRIAVLHHITSEWTLIRFTVDEQMQHMLHSNAEAIVTTDGNTHASDPTLGYLFTVNAMRLCRASVPIGCWHAMSWQSTATAAHKRGTSLHCWHSARVLVSMSPAQTCHELSLPRGQNHITLFGVGINANGAICMYTHL